MESNLFVKHSGFDPGKEYLDDLYERLSRFSELCPYDSALNVMVEKKDAQFAFHITLHFVGGCMESESYGLSLEKVTKKGLDKLYDQICAWHTRRFEEDETVPSANAPRVLIVDDDPLSTEFLSRCLKNSGCKTNFVDNGLAAIEEIATSNYDLIFLDWNMPGMNGRETLLSAQNRLSYDGKLDRKYANLRLPVITYSGQSRKDIQLPECRHFRFVDHWDKSTPFHQLMSQASDVLFRFKTVGA